MRLLRQGDRNPVKVPATNVHPATKQLHGRMQPQALPSSLTVMPVFMASGHTTKTSAMPSNSTLHYAAKQLDDTVINNRTQPFTRQLDTSPPAKQLDGSSWFKSWQQTLPNNHCSAAIATCQHMQVDTNELLLSTTKQPNGPRPSVQNPENARIRPQSHTTFPPGSRAQIPPHSICNADHTIHWKYKIPGDLDHRKQGSPLDMATLQQRKNCRHASNAACHSRHSTLTTEFEPAARAQILIDPTKLLTTQSPSQHDITPWVTAPEKVAAPPMEITSASDRRRVRCLVTQSDGTLHVGSARDSQGVGQSCRIGDRHDVCCLVAETNRARHRRRSVERGGARDSQRAGSRNRAIDGDGVHGVRPERHVAT